MKIEISNKKIMSGGECHKPRHSLRSHLLWNQLSLTAMGIHIYIYIYRFVSVATLRGLINLFAQY